MITRRILWSAYGAIGLLSDAPPEAGLVPVPVALKCDVRALRLASPEHTGLERALRERLEVRAAGRPVAERRIAVESPQAAGVERAAPLVADAPNRVVPVTSSCREGGGTDARVLTCRDKRPVLVGLAVAAALIPGARGGTAAPGQERWRIADLGRDCIVAAINDQGQIVGGCVRYGPVEHGRCRRVDPVPLGGRPDDQARHPWPQADPGRRNRHRGQITGYGVTKT